MAFSQPEETSTGMMKYDQAVVTAYSGVAQMGFAPPPPPNQAYRGYLPNNVSKLDDASLGDLLNQIATWLSWAECEVTRVSIIKNAQEKKLEFLKSKVRASLRAGDEKLSNPDKDDRVNIDPMVVQEEVNLLVSTAVWEMTRAMARGGQKDWETVSRVITQRGQELDRMARGHTLGQQAAPVGPGSTFRRG